MKGNKCLLIFLIFVFCLPLVRKNKNISLLNFLVINSIFAIFVFNPEKSCHVKYTYHRINIFIGQSLLQLNFTQDAVKHLGWSFFAKVVNGVKAINYFRKKAASQTFDRVLSPPVYTGWFENKPLWNASKKWYEAPMKSLYNFLKHCKLVLKIIQHRFFSLLYDWEFQYGLK